MATEKTANHVTRDVKKPSSIKITTPPTGRGGVSSRSTAATKGPIFFGMDSFSPEISNLLDHGPKFSVPPKLKPPKMLARERCSQ